MCICRIIFLTGASEQPQMIISLSSFPLPPSALCTVFGERGLPCGGGGGGGLLLRCTAGLPNHRTTDHIYSMIAILSIHPDIYPLYLDLNKAFNSVLHNALLRILSSYSIPSTIIHLVPNLYAPPPPHNYPILRLPCGDHTRLRCKAHARPPPRPPHCTALTVHKGQAPPWERAPWPRGRLRLAPP